MDIEEFKKNCRYKGKVIEECSREELELVLKWCMEEIRMREKWIKQAEEMDELFRRTIL